MLLVASFSQQLVAVQESERKQCPVIAHKTMILLEDRAKIAPFPDGGEQPAPKRRRNFPFQKPGRCAQNVDQRQRGPGVLLVGRKRVKGAVRVLPPERLFHAGDRPGEDLRTVVVRVAGKRMPPKHGERIHCALRHSQREIAEFPSPVLPVAAPVTRGMGFPVEKAEQARRLAQRFAEIRCGVIWIKLPHHEFATASTGLPES